MSLRNVFTTNDTVEVLQAISATVQSGLILLIGESAEQYHKEVLSAMELTTRLVVNLHPESTPENSVEHNESDLRVAIHRQNPEEFLSDVSHHFLNLVITGNDFSEQLSEQIQSMLVGGGCWVILDAKIVPESCIDDYYKLEIGSCLILVKQNIQHAKVRRGGRKARLTGET